MRQVNIDEARSRDLCLCDCVDLRQGFRDRLRKLSRWPLELLAERHCPIDLEITELRVRGRPNDGGTRLIEPQRILDGLGPDGLQIALEEHGRRNTG